MTRPLCTSTQEERRAALEILLRDSIPYELRKMLRDMYEALT